MLVDPNDFIGQKIIHYGVYDKPTLDLIEKVLRLQRPRTILDVGANIGNHALALHSLCKRLLAFEPGQRAWSMLEENVKVNSPNNIEAFNFGLSDAAARQTLYVNAAGNLGGSSLQPDHKSGEFTEETVELRVGDVVVDELAVDDIDFMKVDVEGHEEYVFKGMANTMAKCRPLVLVEWEPEEGDRSWLVDGARFDALFPDYVAYALIWNSNKAYWDAHPFGTVRRYLTKLFTRKKRVFTAFDPVKHQERVSDLLLVPQEKIGLMDGFMYR
jgi:FkbM family methyltransferase